MEYNNETLNNMIKNTLGNLYFENMQLLAVIDKQSRDLEELKARVEDLEKGKVEE